MGERESARTIGVAFCVSRTPDYCLAPDKPAAFMIVSYFEQSTRTASSVRMTGCQAFTGISRLETVLGDEPGVGGGLRSGCNKGFCKPVSNFVETVNVEGQLLVAHDTEFEMNCAGPDGIGNTTGVCIYMVVTCPVGGESTTPSPSEAAQAEEPLSQKEIDAAQQEIAAAEQELAEAEAELARLEREKALDLAQSAADVAGVFDPTPASDAVSAGISLGRGDFWGFGLSIVSMVPYFGDAVAKPAKAARVAKNLKKLAGLIEKAKALKARALEKLKAAKDRLFKKKKKHDGPDNSSKDPDKESTGAKVTKSATAPVAKFKDYIFKDGATHGKDKPFRSLGYGKEHSEQLAKLWEQQAANKFAKGEFTLGKLDQFGQRIDIEIAVPGIGNAAGKTSYMRSGWMIQPNGSITLNTPFSGFTR